MAKIEGNLEEFSKQVNEILNYVNEYRKRKIKANGNDMMALYKIVAEYDKKIASFMRNTSSITETNNRAQYMDLLARRADARENKRIIAEAIAKSMKENVFDANGYKDKLSSILSDKEQSKKEVKNLFKALTDYNIVMNNSSNTAIKKADAKVELINACIGYVKNFKGNSDALNIVYDIAAVMGAQNIKAFDSLTDEQLSSLPAKKHVGYQTSTGEFKTAHLSLNFAENATEKVNELFDKIQGKNWKEKEAECEKYLNYMYGSDRFAKHENMKKTLDELDINASDEEKYIKLGEKISEKMPWHNVKLDDTVTSKEKFAHRQEVMRQWFPDDTTLLFGATKDKNKARSFFNELSNQTYNGFFRSFNNSPEYTELMKSLYTYTKKLETNPIQDDANLQAVKDACTKYLEHYEDKDPKKKTEFAKMRRDKVRELLASLGGNDKEFSKATTKKARGNAKKINVAELEEDTKKSSGKTGKKSETKSRKKDIEKAIK